MPKPVIWVGYTTRYRLGGRRFRQAAETLAHELREANPEHDVRLSAVESKPEFLREMAAIPAQRLECLHLVAHAGLYGPMFGTRQWPEQFSRHEWQTSSLPFAPAARAYFHTCRSARWFAPYFARTFGVEAYGYHYYTTFSRTKDRFSWVPPGYSRQAPLYVFGCRGRKSDGWVGAAAKYAGLTAPERMKRYTATEVGATGYDPVADLYDAAFEDIRVRADEWRWLDAHLRSAKPLRVLDIGCGNGSLLCQLAPRLSRGVGLDVSPALVLRARANAERRGVADRLTFQSVTGPTLPLADRSLDCAVSLLSFRYLDWDPLIAEVLRVLVPGGRLLVVDMVQSSLRLWQTPALLSSKARALCAEGASLGYRTARKRLIQDPRWHNMLSYNPMRAEHELCWYLGSRFPKGRMRVINVGLRSKVLAFDSGPIEPGNLGTSDEAAEAAAPSALALSRLRRRLAR